MFNQKIFNKLINLAANNKLPHAILIAGEETQSFNLAKALVKYLLCSKKTLTKEYQCNCQNCGLLNSNNHPDLNEINLLDQEIKIEHIRAANQFVNTTPYISEIKILLINNLHNLNLQAANAFLKTLEEPHLNKFPIIFLLLSNNYKALPATILSRVILINSISQINNAQYIHNDSNLYKLVLQNLYDHWVLNKIKLNQIITQWEKINKQQLIYCLWFIISNLIKNDQHELLVGIRQKISPKISWVLLDSLNYLNKLIILGTQVNWSLCLYNFLLIKNTGEYICQ